jgi:hypothetical protein
MSDPSQTVPRGIEVLVKKASVDAEFRTLLLEKRADAAAEIGLELTPAEEMMLKTVPAEQLEAIVARTKVPEEHRRVFLGRTARLMLLTLGMVAGLQTCSLGSRPNLPKGEAGGRPTRPEPKDEPKPPPPPRGIRPDRPGEET